MENMQIHVRYNGNEHCLLKLNNTITIEQIKQSLKCSKKSTCKIFLQGGIPIVVQPHEIALHVMHHYGVSNLDIETERK